MRNRSQAPGAWRKEETVCLHLTLGCLFHREKANLAVTVCNDKEEIMAHSIFLDYPNWNVAKQDDWISVFRELDRDIPCTVRKHKAR